MAEKPPAAEPAGMLDWLPSPLVAMMVVVYFVLNLALNYYNVYLLGKGDTQLHLPIPVFYTMLHQVTIVIFTAVWCLVVPSVRFPVWSTFRSNWFWLVGVSTIYAASIATNNSSFATISLTVNTIFKSAMPFPTMLFSYLIEGKTYSIPIIAIVTVLVAGTIMAVPFNAPVKKHDDGAPQWVGIALVCFSCVATALRPVISSRLMHNAAAAGNRQALTATSMAFFDALIAIPTLAIWSFIAEVWLGDGLVRTFTGDLALRNVGLMAIGCATAGIYGPVIFYTIKLTSSLTFIIIGNFKQLALITGAALFVDKVSDVLLWCGVAVVALASVAYSYQSHQEKTAKALADKAAKQAPLLSKGANENTPLTAKPAGVGANAA